MNLSIEKDNNIIMNGEMDVPSDNSILKTTLPSSENDTSFSQNNEQSDVGDRSVADVSKNKKRSIKVEKVIDFCQEIRLNNTDKQKVAQWLTSRRGGQLRGVGKNNDGSDECVQRREGPYMKFCKEWRPKLQTLNPHLNATELVRMLGLKWGELKMENRQWLEETYGLKVETPKRNVLTSATSTNHPPKLLAENENN
jgi:hypothetical protein